MKLQTRRVLKDVWLVAFRLVIFGMPSRIFLSGELPPSEELSPDRHEKFPASPSSLSSEKKNLLLLSTEQSKPSNTNMRSLLVAILLLFLTQDKVPATASLMARFFWMTALSVGFGVIAESMVPSRLKLKADDPEDIARTINDESERNIHIE
ncbi:hypothetical protein EAE96_008363 [Botrytis aclada]|nr:hypothetical protein EAE96_008363 [Botrytis aclada]